MIDVINEYKNALQCNVSHPTAVIRALLEGVKKAPENATVSELISQLQRYIAELKTQPAIAIHAGCDLFMRLVNHYNPDDGDCKQYLNKQGEALLCYAGTQKTKIIEHCQDFIRDGSSVLIHAYSRVVLSILMHAYKSNKRFFVYCTESRPSDGGYRAFQLLQKSGIPSKLILDSAVGYYMDRIDLVLVGAQGVVENGGLINSIGTFQIATMAKNCRKPMYAAAESLKFMRIFPLNQYDLPNTPPLQTFHDDTFAKVPSSVAAHEENGPESVEIDPTWGAEIIIDKDQDIKKDLLQTHPLVDYTPPQFITLLFTDIGVLTPSGVSDELIKIYYN